MKKIHRALMCLGLFLLLAGVLLLTSCGDNSKSKTESSQQVQTKTLGQSRGMRGIQPVSKSAAKVQQKRIAMVIGNSDYEKSKLKNPVNDARSMARLLRRLDFDVDLVENGSRRDMVSEMNAFGRKLGQVDVGLFYYAGHGIQVKGRNYLIPTDAVLETEGDVEFEAIDLGRVLSKMEDSHCPLNIVILDACRDNPFARSFRSTSKGLALVDAPRGTLLAFSTAPGSVAADGKGNNGIYTKHLLANIERPDLSIEEVFKQVRIGVVNDTDGKQTPWESSSLMGSFNFQEHNQAAGNTAPTKKVESIAPELTASPNTSLPKSQSQSNSKPNLIPAQKPKPKQVASIKRQPASTPAVKRPKLSPNVKKYIRMLQSSSAKDQRYAAKKICKSYLHNRTLLDAVNKQLLRNYQKSDIDRRHIDAMAWFCNVLGRSKQPRYANTLEKVANSDANRKLKKYASKNLRYLQ
jgi:uncharacterized caspase-like protein